MAHFRTIRWRLAHRHVRSGGVDIGGARRGRRIRLLARGCGRVERAREASAERPRRRPRRRGGGGFSASAVVVVRIAALARTRAPSAKQRERARVARVRARKRERREASARAREASARAREARARARARGRKSIGREKNNAIALPGERARAPSSPSWGVGAVRSFLLDSQIASAPPTATVVCTLDCRVHARLSCVDSTVVYTLDCRVHVRSTFMAAAARPLSVLTPLCRCLLHAAVPRP